MIRHARCWRPMWRRKLGDMGNTGIHFGVSGTAVLRAADAMLRALGGDQVSLLFAAVGMPDDPSAQLGLMDPGVEEVQISPVVVRNLPTSNSGPRRRLEFLLPGAAIAAEAVARNAASPQAMLDGAMGVMHDGGVLHIEGITTEYFAGTAYLFRVVAVE
jgi:hypothetical protein